MAAINKEISQNYTDESYNIRVANMTNNQKMILAINMNTIACLLACRPLPFTCALCFLDYVQNN